MVGLVASFVGAVLLGISTQLGVAAGYGGPIGWKTPWWRAINAAGWILLTAGFGLQLADGYRTRRRPTPAKDRAGGMGTIRRPMAVGPWVHLDIYAEYAKLVKVNLEAGRSFEAMAVSVICLDVLLTHMIDGLLVHHTQKLTRQQIAALEHLERGRYTSGQIIKQLKEHRILDQRLIRALDRMNDLRNALVHPFERGHLKPAAIVPEVHASGEQALDVYRLLCHIIDVAGGQSPRKEQRRHDSYMRERHQEWQKLR